jgi:excisionase family DNA binding protein
MTKLTLGQAAKLAGVGKTTLTRAIKSGRLSADRREDGSYRIDPAELSRVYEISVETPATGNETGNVAHRATAGRDSRETAETTAQQAALDERIAGLQEIVRRLDEQARDLREERDAWRVQAENASQAVMLLTDQSSRRSWWRRLVG